LALCDDENKDNTYGILPFQKDDFDKIMKIFRLPRSLGELLCQKTAQSAKIIFPGGAGEESSFCKYPMLAKISQA
jgi:hypothetical protein